MYTIKPLEFRHRNCETKFARYTYQGNICADLRNFFLRIATKFSLESISFDTEQECIDAANKHNVEQCEKMLDKATCHWCNGGVDIVACDGCHYQE